MVKPFLIFLHLTLKPPPLCTRNASPLLSAFADRAAMRHRAASARVPGRGVRCSPSWHSSASGSAHWPQTPIPQRWERFREVGAWRGRGPTTSRRCREVKGFGMFRCICSISLKRPIERKTHDIFEYMDMDGMVCFSILKH